MVWNYFWYQKNFR